MAVERAVERVAQGRRLQAGVGLVELMISMLIGLFIMAGVVQMLSTTSQSALAAAGSRTIQESVRYSFTRIADDMAKSGNLGCVSATIDADTEARVNDEEGSIVRNLLAFGFGPNQLYDYKTIVGGHDNATALTPPAGAVAAGTDTFMIRYASHLDRILVENPLDNVTPSSITLDPDSTAYDRLRQHQVVMVSDCSRAAVFMITNDPRASEGVLQHQVGVVAPAGGLNGGQQNAEAENRLVGPLGRKPSSLMYLYAGATGSYQYYIGTSAAAGGAQCDRVAARQHCALFRRANGLNEELLQGVHDMDVEYGWTVDAVLTFGSAARVSEEDVWDLVDRAKITLSFNSIDNARSSGGNTMDNLLSKAVTRTIYLPNQLL
ncbi:MAG: hypothetical protein KTR20_08290 [Cellvibrionaceae bacterium]|nr:hypothetical protein [Cellvibrionaceae bacterium]